MSDHISSFFWKWGVILRAKLQQRLHWRIAPARPGEIRALLKRRKELGLLGTKPEYPLAETVPESVARLYLERRFDLLNTGWRSYGTPEGLDWNAGYATGGPGKDIKLPWELGRLQHLPQLAWRACQEPVNSSEVSSLAKEFKRLVSDFRNQNPVGEGLNWRCAMDVSIRLCNLLVSFDLFTAAGWNAPDAFLEDFLALVVEHGRFLFRNLEWVREGRGNHYLSDLIGLLFASVWLPKGAENSRWLAFAAGELKQEAGRQFLPDGSNFEGSVFYHRLSLELLSYSYLLLRGPARRKRRGNWDLRDLERLLPKAFRFLEDLSDSAGHGVQFGDNDSGRLLKLGPHFLPGSPPREDSLWVGDSLSLASALYAKAPPAGPDAQLAAWLVGESSPLFSSSSPAEVEKFHSPPPKAPKGAVEYHLKLEGFQPETLRAGAYPDFGVYFWRNSETGIWIRCGAPSRDGHYGHAHFDQLHVEIRHRGRHISFDPGSFAYTGNLPARNFFRGPEAHFIPRIPSEESQARQDVDAFRYPGLPTGHCLSFDARAFHGTYSLGKKSVFRLLRLEPGEVQIFDWGDEGMVSKLPNLSKISWGYGREAVRSPEGEIRL